MIGAPAKCLVWLCLLCMAVAPRYLSAEEAKADSTTQSDPAKEEAKPELNPEQEVLARALQSVLKVELSFLNRVADLTDKQLAQAIAIGKSQVEDEVRRFSQNAGRQDRLVIRMAQGVERRSANLRDTLESALHLRFQELLQEDQQRKYASELEMRAKYEKQAVVDYLVSAFDSRLHLNAEQRTEITERLLQVPGGSLPEIQMVTQYGQYLPKMDDQKILPSLNEDQRKILSGIQRVTFSSSNHLEANRPFIVDDIDLEIEIDP